ncbi:MAG TPA: YqhA family protein [Nitrospirota bacterium]|nr:YqhA family protein [Nitrospirota bacterium]
MLKAILVKANILFWSRFFSRLSPPLLHSSRGRSRLLPSLFTMAATRGEDPLGAVELINIMDTFLIAAAFFIFSGGLYELFIEDVAMPAWLIVHNLHDLMAKLASVLAVTFLEHLMTWKDPNDTLYFGIAISLVSASLIAFSYFSDKD